MALIYVTGNSGSGKSTVRKELLRRGYEAHDTDENDISSWQNKLTGKTVYRPELKTDRTKEWYGEHDWNMSREKVESLRDVTKDRVVFLCGSTSNADEMIDLFDKMYYLSIDQDTLTNRLLTRTDNDFGKAPDELDNITGWHDSLETRYRSYGAEMLDASKPVKEVIDIILESLD